MYILYHLTLTTTLSPRVSLLEVTSMREELFGIIGRHFLTFHLFHPFWPNLISDSRYGIDANPPLASMLIFRFVWITNFLFGFWLAGFEADDALLLVSTAPLPPGKICWRSNSCSLPFKTSFSQLSNLWPIFQTIVLYNSYSKSHKQGCWELLGAEQN